MRAGSLRVGGQGERQEGRSPLGLAARAGITNAAREHAAPACAARRFKLGALARSSEREGFFRTFLGNFRAESGELYAFCSHRREPDL